MSAYACVLIQAVTVVLYLMYFTSGILYLHQITYLNFFSRFRAACFPYSYRLIPQKIYEATRVTVACRQILFISTKLLIVH